MDKNTYNPAQLAHKWQQGTISRDEKAWFEQWYGSFNDEEIIVNHATHTTSQQLGNDMFKNISAQIDKQPRPATKVITLWRSLAAAAMLLFVIGLGVLYVKNTTDTAQQLLVSSTAGQHKQITLPDGSKVWLSPSTQISYPAQFNGDRREISLTGEAFFEVVHDDVHPFIISSGSLKTVVLGTSFNVRAYPKASSASVTVVSGKVGVILNTANKHTQHILVANQRSVYYPATGVMVKEDHANGVQLLDQCNGLFNFNGESLSAIVHELQLQYGVTISVDEHLTGKAFYGSLNTTQPLTQTLDRLCTVMEIKWTKNNGSYSLQ